MDFYKFTRFHYNKKHNTQTVDYRRYKYFLNSTRK